MDPVRARQELDGLEREFTRLSVNKRRERALDLAQAAGSTIDVPEDELRATAAAVRAGGPAGLGIDVNRLAAKLATDERRLSVRLWAADLSLATREDFPRFAEAFDRLAREPLPADAATDDLWLHACFGLVVEAVLMQF